MPPTAALHAVPVVSQGIKVEVPIIDEPRRHILAHQPLAVIRLDLKLSAPADVLKMCRDAFRRAGAARDLDHHFRRTAHCACDLRDLHACERHRTLRTALAITYKIERGVSLADSKCALHVIFPRASTATSGTQCVTTVSALLSCIHGFFAPRLSFAENTSKLSPPKSAVSRVFFSQTQTKSTIGRARLFTTAMKTNCGRRKSFADFSSKLSPTKISSCVIVDAGKAPMKSLGSTHHELF